MSERTITTQCCIAGGGPAGLMLGFLLARQGVDVCVAEKHADFFRDFRGDTIHPSTMRILDELGLLDEFLALPHTESRRLTAHIGDHRVVIADFSHLKAPAPFIAFMPQWDFLKFIQSKAAQYSGFHLLMGTCALETIEENSAVAGLRCEDAQGAMEIRADLIIGADGRHSTVRDCSGLKVKNAGAPMDVLWFRLSRRREDDPQQTFGRIDRGQMMVVIGREDYWQCALLIRKGAYDSQQKLGLDALRTTVGELLPWMSNRTREIQNWDDIKLLTVRVDRLEQWCKEGLLMIGDAAHAMSPVGGVGINLAIQDAVAAANILGPVLMHGKPACADLAKVQRRRQRPARIIQRLQIFIQNRLIDRVLKDELQPASKPPNSDKTKLPWILRLMNMFPILRRIPARIIGLGFRSEHVRH